MPGAGRRGVTRRRRRLRRAWVLLLLLALPLLLTSDWFEERARQWLERRLESETREPVHLGRLELHWLPPAAVIETVELGQPGGLWLAAERVELALRPSSLLRLRLVPQRLAVSKPRLRLEGLPDLDDEGTRGGLRLQLEELRVVDGEILVERERWPVELAIHDLNVAGWVGEEERRARIEIGRLELAASPDAATLGGLTLVASAVVEDDGLRQVSFEGRSVEGSAVEGLVGAVAVRGSGEVDWSDGLGVALDGSVDGRVEDLLALAGRPSPLAGPLAASGSFVRDRAAWQLLAQLESSELAGWHQRLTAVSGELEADAAGVRGRLTSARLGSGELHGAFSLTEPLAGGPLAGELHIDLGQLPLATLLADSEIGERLDGALSGHFDYDFAVDRPLAGRGLGNLLVTPGRSGLASATAAGSKLRAGAIALAASLEMADGQLQAKIDSLELPGLAAKGRWEADVVARSWRGRLEADLEAPEAALPALASLRPSTTPLWQRWVRDLGRAAGSGHFVAKGSGSFSTAALSVAGELQAFATATVTTDRLHVSMSSRGAKAVELEATAWRGDGTADLRATLRPSSSDRRVGSRAELEVDGWPLASIRLDQVISLYSDYSDLDESGTLASNLTSAEGRISGSVSVDAESISAKGVALDLTVGDRTWGDLETELRYGFGALEIVEARLEGTAGIAEARGMLPLRDPASRWRLDVEVPRFDLPRLLGQPLADRLAARGHLRARFRGTRETPEVSLRGGAEAVDFRHDDGDRTALGRAQVAVDWKEEELRLEASVGHWLSMEGGGSLRRLGFLGKDRSRDGETGRDEAGALPVTRGLANADLELRWVGEDLEPLVRLALAAGLETSEPELEAQGGHYRGSWHLLELEGSEPTVEIVVDELEASSHGFTLRSAEPIRLTVDSSEARLEALSLEATTEETTEISSIFATGRAALAEEGWPLDVGVEVELAAEWLKLLTTRLEAEGTILGLAEIGGSLLEPTWNGQAGLRSGRLVWSGFPHSLEEVEALFFLYPDRLVLDRLDGTLGGGEARLQGEWLRSTSTSPRSRRQVTAQLRGVTLRYPEDWLVRGDADLLLTASAGSPPRLGGHVELEELRYLSTVNVGFESFLRAALEPTRQTVQRVDETVDSIELGLEVVGDRALRIQNNVASLNGDLDLLLVDTLARPRLLGEIVVEPGGHLDYGGDDYEVRRGVLTFASATSNDPLIDLEASTRRRNYEVTLSLSGTRQRLETSLRSNPPLPELDVLSLLAAGDTSDSFERRPTGLEGAAASSVAAHDFLYGQASALIEQRFLTLFGIDRFRVNPLRGSDALSRARLTVGKRLSKDVVVTYSIDPSTSDESVLEVEWQINDHLVLVVTQNGDGTYAADARLEQSFR